MNLGDLLGGMRRRWYIVLAGLIVTGALCVGAYQVVPASYTAQASVLLLPPNSTVGTGGNPYLSLGGLQGAVDVLGRAMTSEQTVDELTAGSTTESYSLEADATTSGPILVLAVKARSADGALALMQHVLDKAPATLRELQSEVAAPEESLISLSVIAKDVTATKDQKSQIRTLIVVLAGGLALTLLGTIAVDALLRRRSARRGGSPSEPLAGPVASGSPTAARTEPPSAVPPRPRSGLRSPRPVPDRLQ